MQREQAETVEASTSTVGGNVAQTKEASAGGTLVAETTEEATTSVAASLQVSPAACPFKQLQNTQLRK